MTPLELSILIHYRGHARDFRNGDFNAPAVREAIDWFKGEAMLLEADDGKGAERAYKLTNRGEAFVTALCDMPLPVCKWVMP